MTVPDATYPAVRSSFSGNGVLRVTLDNQAKANSLSPEALTALAATLEAAKGNPDIRAVVVTGAGKKVFCGGADLGTLGALNPRSARKFIRLIHRACAAARDCPVPVIARINGWCLGAGLEFAASCDLRIASANAHFGMPEVKLAIPSVVEAALLPRLMGHGRARWLVMTGENIDARTALNWGLVEKVVPLSRLEKETNQIIQNIISSGAEAIRMQKRLCRMWEEAPLADSIAASIEDLARAYESDEPRRRIAAIRKKK